MDIGMNTRTEMDANLENTEEREVFADAVKSLLETIAKEENTKIIQMKIT